MRIETIELITNVDGRLEEDEELSPTLQTTIVLHWMNILHPKLSDTVTQRFTTELRDSTYARLFPEISRCVVELLAGLEGETVCRTYGYNFGGTSRGRDSYRGRDSRGGRGQSYRKECEYCKVAGRRGFQTHSTSDCSFLRRDNQGRSRAVEYECDDYLDDYEDGQSYQAGDNANAVMQDLNIFVLKIMSTGTILDRKKYSDRHNWDYSGQNIFPALD